MKKDLAQVEMIHKQVQLKKQALSMVQKEVEEDRFQKAQKECEKYQGKIEFLNKAFVTLKEKLEGLENDVDSYSET